MMNKTIAEEEFAKWRCLVALAHVDGVVTPEERNFLSLYFQRIPFSKEQMYILNNDLDQPQDFTALHEAIESEQEREALKYLAFTLFWADSDFKECERHVYECLDKSA